MNLRGSEVTPIHRGSVLLFKQDVEPAVNRQRGFRRELVEQITLFIIHSRNFLHGELLKCEFPDPGVFLPNFHDFF